MTKARLGSFKEGLIIMNFKVEMFNAPDADGNQQMARTKCFEFLSHKAVVIGRVHAS